MVVYVYLANEVGMDKPLREWTWAHKYFYGIHQACSTISDLYLGSSKPIPGRCFLQHHPQEPLWFIFSKSSLQVTYRGGR